MKKKIILNLIMTIVLIVLIFIANSGIILTSYPKAYSKVNTYTNEEIISMYESDEYFNTIYNNKLEYKEELEAKLATLDESSKDYKSVSLESTYLSNNLMYVTLTIYYSYKLLRIIKLVTVAECILIVALYLHYVRKLLGIDIKKEITKRKTKSKKGAK